MFSQPLLDALQEGLAYGAVAAIFAVFLTPLQVLKVVRQETGKSYKYILSNYFIQKHWIYLFSGALAYASMNFCSNLSFGIGNFIADKLLVSEVDFAYKVALRSLLGGLLETLLTFYSEGKQISQSKGFFLKGEVKFLPLIFPLFLRNSLVWCGAACTYELTSLYFLSYFYSVLLSLGLGVVFATISLPLDVFVTHRCGENKLNYWHLFVTIKGNKLFLGISMRLIQIALFTAVTVLTMFFFHPLD